MNKYTLSESDRLIVATSGFVATVGGFPNSMSVSKQFPFSALSGIKVNELGLFTDTNKKPKYDHIKSRTEKGVYRPRNPMQFSQGFSQFLFKTSPDYISLSTWKEIMGTAKIGKIQPTNKQLLDMVVLDFISSRVGNTRKISYTHNSVEYKLTVQQEDKSRRG